MIDDARLAKLLVQSGILSREALADLEKEKIRTNPPSSLHRLVVEKGIATEDRLREVAARADQYTETTVAVTKIGKFEVRGEVGRGGMGIVYRAWQPDLQRTVALKVIAPGGDPAFKERFLREARVASRLRHPNIVPVFEYGEESGSAYFAMDFVKGESLDRAMKSRTIEQNARLLATIARALDHAHGQGLIHRDIKPQNILVAEDGTPFLTDFGLAREANVQSPLTVTGQILGTPAFMSPEQARGKAELGPASDLYSLGAVLYVALTGVAPFRGDSVYDLLDAIIKTPPASPRSLNAKVPPALEAICLRCLEKDPAKRYPSAGALADDLDRVLSGAPPPVRVPARKTPMLLVGAAVAAVVLAIAWILRAPDAETSKSPPAPAVDPSWFGVPMTGTAKQPEWIYTFANRDLARDWQINAAVSRGSRPYEVGFDSGGLRLCNTELRFLAPVEAPGSLAVSFSLPTPGSAIGISYGGCRLLRTPGAITLTAGGREVASKSLQAAGLSEILELEIGADGITARVNGTVALREPLRSAAQAVRPTLWTQDDVAVLCTSAAVKGAVRSGWAGSYGLQRQEFQKVGKGYRLEAAQNLLVGEGAGRFRNQGPATPTRDGTALRFRDADQKTVELHGPNVRNSRLLLKYSHAGKSLSVRVRAGFHEVTIPLPCGGAAHEAVIVALEDRFRCLVDGAFDLDSSTSNGTELDHITIKIKATGGEFTIHEAILEPIGGVPPQKPWIMLFQGSVQGLAMPETWTIRDGLLAGRGELKTLDPWNNLEAEIVLFSQPDATLTFGARGAPLLDGKPLSLYEGGFSGFNFRLQGKTAELENDAMYSRRAAPEGSGPFTVRVEGAPVRIFSFRARQLP